LGIFFSLKICFVWWLHLWSDPWSDPWSNPIQILSTLLEGRVVLGSPVYITWAWDEILTSSLSSERNCLESIKKRIKLKIIEKFNSRLVPGPLSAQSSSGFADSTNAENPAYSHLTLISMASEGDVEKGKQDKADENVSSITSLVVTLRNDTVTNVCSPSS